MQFVAARRALLIPERKVVVSGPTTWDLAHKTTNVVLSNGNRTATISGSGETTEGVRSTHSFTTAKIYYEITLDNYSGNLWSGGFSTPSATLGFYVETSPTLAFGLITSSGNFGDKDSPDDVNGGIAALTTGDRLGIAFDPVALLAWFRKNGGAWNPVGFGGATQNPATGQGGARVVTTGDGPPYYAWMGLPDCIGGGSFTANFASTDWVDTPPTGFGQL